MKKITIATLLLVASLLAAVGCGSSSGGGKDITVTWLYYGPKDDGGYNVTMEDTQNAAAQATGVTSNALYQLPFNAQASQAAKQAIASGSDVLVDTIGLGKLFTKDVCEPNQQIKCLSTADPEPQPKNTEDYWIQDWNLNYVAGVAAGLMTKSNTVGFIGAYKIPIIVQAANAYQMGCESVNPKCQTRVVISGQYFNPPKNNAAVNTLIDSGADVIRNWIDDPGFCQVAQQRGVYAVGEFYDFHGACSKSIITSTVWSFIDYFTKQYKAIQNGTFKGGGYDLVPMGYGPNVPHLGTWGPFVPDNVRKKVEAVYKSIVDGKDVFVGPIYDQNGNLRFKKGQKVPERFIWAKWNWYVKGVISS